ncbi:hypothetical protein GlitD10_2700 [Gloeomargarita lithophora Alchichica-D10]|uniref:DUF86 domain-containing protein n=1 Tax=Gloeomargarita lithophora Alchichica-D10 TaxID=1188229 RepID=A0A1J0AGM8_9CYAN|nr:HepT-like ribonuclease domain-containing protein [Gloeomargarita lithophora]APB35043.1 hypothetical protein GlitD10_2700 [Gloeomargarita lithophora Alchichica-D10]
MQSNNRDVASIWDMVQSIRRIQSFTNDQTFDEYLNDIRTISAVERQFEVLGEAARRISNEFRQAHPIIDWQRIVGLRNIVAHRYDEVRQDILWTIIHSELAPLLAQLESILPPLPNEQ